MSKPAGKGSSGAASGGDGDGRAQELLHDLVSEGDDGGTGDETPEQTIARLTEDRDRWKSSSRKHEERNRVLKPAADELAELKAAGQSDQEKLAEAIRRSDELQTRLDQLTVARQYGLLGGEDDDQVLDLLGTGSTEVLEQRAERLARLVNGQRAPEAEQNGSGSGRGGFGSIEEAAAAAGVGRGRRPVEGLRAGGTPGSGTSGGPGESPNDLFRGLLDR
jgi:hypothetical protein